MKGQVVTLTQPPNREITLGKQLGKSGKEGTTYEAGDNDGVWTGAFKSFRDPNKSESKIEKEYNWQAKAAEVKAAPNVYGYNRETHKGIAMDKMEKTLVKVVKDQGGYLNKEQQLELIDLCLRLDRAGIYHCDPNPLNVMTNEKDEFRWIDYGMTRKIEPKKHGFNPNVRALRALVHGGMHGLKTAYRALKLSLIHI